MFHTEIFTTNWHDTGADRLVRPSALLVYMQETANAHINSCGKSLDRLRDEDGLAFVLSRISLRFVLPLHAYEKIRITTWLSESRGVAFNRHFRVVRDGDGAVVAEASSVWALLRLADRSFARVDEVESPAPEEPIDDLLSHRVRMPKIAMPRIAERTVLRSECDYNLHMNNTRYPDMVCDYMHGYGPLLSMTLIWRHEATLGHTLAIERTGIEPVPGDTGRVSYLRTVDKESGEVCLEAEVVSAL